MYSLCYDLLYVILVISNFGFEGGTLVLIASVHSHCLSFTFPTCGLRILSMVMISLHQNNKTAKHADLSLFQCLHICMSLIIQFVDSLNDLINYLEG